MRFNPLKTAMLAITLFITLLQSSAAQTIYHVSMLPNEKTLAFSVTRENPSQSSTFILRRAMMGVAPQVEAIECDHLPLKTKKTGQWIIPAGCSHISWRTPLADGNVTLASAQQSLKTGNVIMISEASSLPRLKDEIKPKIALSIPYQTVFPATDHQHAIALNNLSKPPLFILINFQKKFSLKTPELHLTYLLDQAKFSDKLPLMKTHLKGIIWLYTQLHTQQKQDFTLGWLSLPVNQHSLGGATGDHLLLVNYPSDGEVVLGKTLRLYIALHEAFHQFIENEKPAPTWASESLASYFGMEATLAALNTNSDSEALMQKFMKSGDVYSDDLLTINQKVKNGDSAQYGAFYTKGLAFWHELDVALKAQGDNLSAHLIAITRMPYDKRGYPIKLREICKLSTQQWAPIAKIYLGE